MAGHNIANTTVNRIVLITIVILFALAGFFFLSRTKTSENGIKDDSRENSIQTNTIKENENNTYIEISKPKEVQVIEEEIIYENPFDNFEVSDQPSGSFVNIDKLLLSKRLWIVVYELNSMGETGNILGAGRFREGTHNNVNIELLRATTSGKKYLVLLHSNDGNDSFDSKSDIAIDGERGFGIEFTTF